MVAEVGEQQFHPRRGVGEQAGQYHRTVLAGATLAHSGEGMVSQGTAPANAYFHFLLILMLPS
jgi:hypothetical protein